MITSTSFKTRFTIAALFVLFALSTNVAKAQYLLNSDSAFKAEVPNSGRIWGLTFGDFYYKGHADSSQRGGANQYAGIPQSRTAFQFRRIYLGYDYNYNSKFSAELILAAEDNFPVGNPPSTTTTSSSTASGDELTNQKFSFYIKFANIRWKNIWKGTDFILGQSSTPTYNTIVTDVWNYRSIEGTITNVHKNSNYDFGAALRGTFDPETKNFGYNILVGNGTGAKPESNNFKWFYGEVYGYFFNKKLLVDLYSDYYRLNWTTSWHHSRQMNKIFLAYNSAASKNGMLPGTGYTIGVEAFVNNLKNDNFATLQKAQNGKTVDTLNNQASGISVFVHGDIIKNKLRFFARYDAFNPLNIVNNGLYKQYLGQAGAGYADNTFKSNPTPATTPSVALNDETYKTQFTTAGLDVILSKNVHFQPNIWYTRYTSQLTTQAVSSVVANNYDLVYRATFFYTFGK